MFVLVASKKTWRAACYYWLRALFLHQSVHSLRKYSKCTNLFHSLSYGERNHMWAYDIPLKPITTLCIATFCIFYLQTHTHSEQKNVNMWSLCFYYDTKQTSNLLDQTMKRLMWLYLPSSLARTQMGKRSICIANHTTWLNAQRRSHLKGCNGCNSRNLIYVYQSGQAL